MVTTVLPYLKDAAALLGATSAICTLLSVAIPRRYSRARAWCARVGVRLASYEREAELVGKATNANP